MKFEKARDEYERQREVQRQALSNYLKVHKGLNTAGLHIVTAGTAGKGCEHYNSQGRIAPFDLRNWKWVEVKGQDGFDRVISLNMLEMDKNTKDIHSLYDRIGFVFSPDPAGWVFWLLRFQGAFVMLGSGEAYGSLSVSCNMCL